MNFKKYHVGRNLFDKNNVSYFNGYYVSDSNSIREYPNNAMLYIPITVGVTYTISGVKRYDTSVTQRYLLTSVVPANQVQVVRHFVQTQNIPLTFTAGTDENYLVVMICGDSDCAGYGSVATAINANSADIMLNTGSTALPYEPYGNSWHNTPHYIHKTDTDTITTLPAVLYPNGTTATVGLKGNTVQNGTLTPTTPIQPQGTGERTGNLINIYTNDTSNGYINNAMLRIRGDIYTPSSTYICEYQPINEGVTYTLNTGGKTGDAQSICFYTSDKQFISGIAYESRTIITFTTPQGARYFRCTVMRTSVDVESYKHTMLNTGSTPLPYENFGYKIPISSANTTTPIYLGEVEATRKIRKLVLTGEKNVDYNNVDKTLQYIQCRYTLSYTGTSIATNVISTHLETASAPSETARSEKIAMRVNATDILFGLAFSTIGAVTTDTNTAILSKARSYLAAQYANGTPVTVWYVLATPTTGIVNEPLRKIGDYADEVSGITIPVTTGGDTLSVDTTVQPSEVTVNYKGWHPVTDVHEKSKNLIPELYNGGVDSSKGAFTDNNMRVRTDIIPLSEGEYTLTAGNLVCATGAKYLDGVYVSSIGSISGDNEIHITVDSTFNGIAVGFRTNPESIITVDNAREQMLNIGSTALPYEPYWK